MTRLDDQGLFLAVSEIFLFPTAYRIAVKSTQPPISMYQGLNPQGVKQPGHGGDHSDVVQRLRLHGAIPSLPHTFSRCANLAQLHLNGVMLN